MLTKAGHSVKHWPWKHYLLRDLLRRLHNIPVKPLQEVHHERERERERESESESESEREREQERASEREREKERNS